MVCAPAVFSATVIPITSFDPTTFFTGVTAGFDFNGANGPNQSGFTGITPGAGSTYNAVSNGITLDLTISNFNATAHRNRNNAAAGNLVMDFAQWYHTVNANAEAAFSFTGLETDTEYDISFFVYNVGAGQMRHKFYEGTSSADPLITTYTTSGSQLAYATWSPGITFRINSGASGRIDVTMQEDGSRLNMNGISLVQVPEPSSIFLFGLGGLALCRHSRRWIGFHILFATPCPDPRDRAFLFPEKSIKSQLHPSFQSLPAAPRGVSQTDRCSPVFRNRLKPNQ